MADRSKHVNRGGRSPSPRQAHPVLMAVLIVAAAVLLAAAALLNTAKYTGVFRAVAAQNRSDPSATPSEPSSQPSSEPVSDPSSDPSSDPGTDPVPQQTPVFSFPEEMRAARITPGEDYDTAADWPTVCGQIDKALGTLMGYGFNTVLMPVTVNGEPVCPSAVQPAPDAGVTDPAAYLLARAREQGLYVYAVFDCGVFSGRFDPVLPQESGQVQALFERLLRCYAVDGWLLAGYGYAYGDTCDADAFAARSDPEQSLFDFKAQAVDALVRGLTAAVRAKNINLSVGLLSNGVWAHRSVDGRGSATNNVYEDWTDGAADTLAWVQEGLFDFVTVQIYTSTNNAQASFTQVLNWWNEVCRQAQRPLYVLHASHLAGSGRAWSSPDQLTLQLLLCRKADSWKGSGYTSLTALQKNPGGSTDALCRAYSGTLFEEYISQTLQMTSPGKATVTVDDPDYVLRGSADPNFPLLLNGRELSLTTHGYFAEPVTLTPGINTFTFTHKGKTDTFTVIYTVRVIRSVEPAQDLTVDGGSVLAVSAVALKGSTVTFTFNGRTYPMTASPIQQQDDPDESLSAFENFTGSCTLPEGVPGKTLPLGQVQVSAAFNGLQEDMSGGRVTLRALPVQQQAELPDTIDGLTMRDPSAGSAAVLASGRAVVITADYAETLNGGKATDDYSRPTNAYMPRGTTDVLVKTISANGSVYYLLGCGRRIYAPDAWLSDGEVSLRRNTLAGAAVSVASDYT